MFFYSIHFSILEIELEFHKLRAISQLTGIASIPKGSNTEGREKDGRRGRRLSKFWLISLDILTMPCNACPNFFNLFKMVFKFFRFHSPAKKKENELKKEAFKTIEDDSREIHYESKQLIHTWALYMSIKRRYDTFK